MTGLESLAIPILAGLIGYVLRHVNVFGQSAGGFQVASPAPPAQGILAELERIVGESVRTALSQTPPLQTGIAPTMRPLS